MHLTCRSLTKEKIDQTLEEVILICYFKNSKFYNLENQLIKIYSYDSV